jgi:hypothetical protein
MFSHMAAICGDGRTPDILRRIKLDNGSLSCQNADGLTLAGAFDERTCKEEGVVNSPRRLPLLRKSNME